MPFEHHFRSRFEFGRLSLEVGACAALGLGCVARQLDAVNGKHLAPDESLLVADVEYLREDACNVLSQRRNKSGDGGEVRLAVAGQCNEGDVMAAAALDVA